MQRVLGVLVVIRESKTWIHMVPASGRTRSPIAGKWLCFGSTKEMHAYRDLLDRLVEDGTFLAAKMARKDPATDPFPHKQDCVVCVYTSADKTQIERTSFKLKQIGLTPSAWKSDQQSKADWQAGGKLALEADVAEKKRALRTAAAHAERTWDVFISKNSNDAAHARQVYDYLTRRGLKVFLSEVSLPAAGDADYQKTILAALDGCKHLVVVASSKEHLESRWVQAEWSMFLNELWSGRKNGNALTVLAGPMTIGELPLSLRSFQVERLTEGGLEAVCRFVSQ